MKYLDGYLYHIRCEILLYPKHPIKIQFDKRLHHHHVTFRIVRGVLKTFLGGGEKSIHHNKSFKLKYYLLYIGKLVF